MRMISQHALKPLSGGGVIATPRSCYVCWLVDLYMHHVHVCAISVGSTDEKGNTREIRGACVNNAAC